MRPDIRPTFLGLSNSYGSMASAQNFFQGRPQARPRPGFCSSLLITISLLKQINFKNSHQILMHWLILSKITRILIIYHILWVKNILSQYIWLIDWLFFQSVFDLSIDRLFNVFEYFLNIFHNYYKIIDNKNNN